MQQLLRFVLLCVVIILYQTYCVDSQTFKAIPGGGDRRYLFSEENRNPPLTWNDAVQWCQLRDADLATAGHLPATEADPLLKYAKENNIARSWIGAYKVGGTTWKWSDERVLNYYSNLWQEVNPSGDGPCVEIILGKSTKRAYLNDRSCTNKLAFVCEKNN